MEMALSTRRGLPLSSRASSTQAAGIVSTALPLLHFVIMQLKLFDFSEILKFYFKMCIKQRG